MASRLSYTIKRSISLLIKDNPYNISPLFLTQAYSQYHHNLSHPLCSSNSSSLSKDNQSLQVQGHHSCFSPCVIPIRNYGRKVKAKPEKITFFEYSGDLRTLPEIDKEALLYPYLDHQEEFESDEISKKLASFEFGSELERNRHMQQMVQDRIIELFGPDSELEQRIARFTLHIRQKIPYCIQNRTDKFQKIWLLKSIFHRRRLLTTLRELDHERFEWLLRELKIRYVIPQDRPEWMGWKYNLQESTRNDAMTLKRKKLEDFKNKLAAEKESFAERKAKILSEIDKDLEAYGLTRDFLDDVQKKEVEKRQRHKILSWEERVKLGMTAKIKEYYG